MAYYKVNSTNSRDFSLSKDNVPIGDLKYSKWYSFKANILLADKSNYTLEPKGFWDSKIELTNGEESLLFFEMGWKGIVINFNKTGKTYLIRLKGLLSNKYVLVDTDEYELLAVEVDFKWNKLTFDFNIETSAEFEDFEQKEVLLLTTIHCLNYYMSFVNASM